MRPVSLRLLASVLLVLALSGAASAASQLEDFQTMFRLAQMAQRVSQDVSREDLRMMRIAMMELRGASEGATVKYRNGQTATLYAHREGATLKYPNGQNATLYSGREGATWKYPNGQNATLYKGRDGATWKYPNGQTITLYAGRVGATWKHPNGQTATLYAGRRGATWYDESGSVLLDNGPELSPEELLDVPEVVVRLLWFME